MNKKCIGCGAILQSEDAQVIGYINKQDLEKVSLCERCFRIRHYGDYKAVYKDNAEYLSILKNISKTGNLVLLVVDVFNIDIDWTTINSVLDNPTILVLSKRDILPKDIYEQKILDYMDRYHYDFIDKIFISSNKNYHLDDLMLLINKYKTSDKVYVVGQTNSGKSTLINKLIYNYSDQDFSITTSIMPSTTLNTIDVRLSDSLTLIDTPGLLDNNSLVNLVSGQELKKIIPNQEIYPINYQINKKQTIVIDKYAKIDCYLQANITLFISRQLNVKRLYNQVKNDHFIVKTFKVKPGIDIVIRGLGFIKINKATTLDLWVMNGVDVYLRDSLI